MSRYRLHPTPAQEEAFLGHCAHTRYVWNLAVEQRSWWQPGHPAPGFATQCRQLSEARAAAARAVTALANGVGPEHQWTRAARLLADSLAT